MHQDEKKKRGGTQMKCTSTKSRFSSNPSNSPNPRLPHTRTGSLGKASSRASDEGPLLTHVGHHPKGYTPSARGQPRTKQILKSTSYYKIHPRWARDFKNMTVLRWGRLNTTKASMLKDSPDICIYLYTYEKTSM